MCNSVGYLNGLAHLFFCKSISQVLIGLLVQAFIVTNGSDKKHGIHGVKKTFRYWVRAQAMGSGRLWIKLWPCPLVGGYPWCCFLISVSCGTVIVQPLSLLPHRGQSLQKLAPSSATKPSGRSLWRGRLLGFESQLLTWCLSQFYHLKNRNNIFTYLKWFLKHLNELVLSTGSGTYNMINECDLTAEIQSVLHW